MLAFCDLEKATEYVEEAIKQKNTVVLSDEIDDLDKHYYREIYYQRGVGCGKKFGKLYLVEAHLIGKKEFLVSKHEFFDFDIAKFKELGCLADLL